MNNEYITENGITDELFEKENTRPYEEGESKAYAPSEDTPRDPNDGTTQGSLLNEEIKRNLRLRQANDILETGSHRIYEEHVGIASEIHNGKIEPKLGRTYGTLENGNHDEYADMASELQSEEIELKLGRANDALENGNHDEYIDMISKMQNGKIE